MSRVSFARTLLIFIFVGSAIRVTTLRTSIDFIRTSCSKTTYPQLCFSTLSSHARAIQTSPKLLALEALNVTLAKAHSVSSLTVDLSKARGLRPREAGAIRDCMQELADTVDELKRSIAEMNGPKSSTDFQLMISDVQTWVSAALTDETTCFDGFAGNAMNGNLKTVVRNHIVEISHVTSNALALINLYASQVN